MTVTTSADGAAVASSKEPSLGALEGASEGDTVRSATGDTGETEGDVVSKKNTRDGV